MSFFLNPNPRDASSGGGTFDGTVEWGNVGGKPQTYPPSNHNHNDLYYTKEESQGHVNFVQDLMEQKQGKVATHESDTPDFLSNKTDNITIEVSGNELKVKSLDGLTVGVADINSALEGVEENVQVQLNDLFNLIGSVSGGMKFKGIAENYAEVLGYGNLENGDVIVVLVDETKNDGRSLYVYSDDLGMWRYLGTFTFSTKFIQLEDTPSGYEDGKYLRSTGSSIVYSDISYQDLKNKPSSTITQIDDAVEKRHDHPNKSILDRFGIDEQNTPTIDGVPYIPKREKKEIFSAYLNPTITVDENDYIKWNSVKPLSNIPYDSSTGMFTLTPGKSYKVIVSVMGAISRYITIHFARGTEKVKSNPYATVYGVTTINNRGGSGVLVTTFTIGETSEGKYGILVGEIGGDATSIELFANRTMLFIEEITDI